MNKNVLLSITLFFTAVSVTAAGGGRSRVPSHPSKIQYGELRWTVPLGTPYRHTLKNGLRAYIAVDSQLPLVQIHALFRYGSLLDPRGKEGLCAITAGALRTCGTRDLHPDTLDARLDLFAMDFSCKASDDMLQFSAFFLSDFCDTAFYLIRQMLFQPRFDSVKLEKEKKIYAEALKHRFDNPGPALGIAYQKSMYSGTPAARLPTEKSVRSISRGDCAALYHRAVTTSGCLFAVAGAFNRSEMNARLEKLFPAAADSDSNRFPVSDIKPAFKCLVIYKPISQVYVRFGCPLFRRPHADYYAVSVANQILGGGGFTSRLGTKVRSDAGLTYSIYSNAQSNYTYPGTWYVGFFTKNESFPKAMDLAVRTVDSLRKHGPRASELSNAKASLIDEMPSMFRSPFDIVSTYAWNEYYGRSPDHYRRYPGSIRKITADAVKNAAAKYLDPDSFTFTIIADTNKLSGQSDTSGRFSLEGLKPRRIISADSVISLP